VRVLSADRGPRLIVYCDGAARGNPGPAGIGVVITGEDGTVVDRIAEGIGVATNNVAEYRAAIAGLSRTAELGATDVLLRSDSRLLVEQLSGRFRVKNPTLQRLHTEARGLLSGFRRFWIEHVPRESNKEADRAANEGVDEWLRGEGTDYVPPEPAPRLWE
jgi:ribonuclease H / adenosylcobalamin/alpha-ribazole phosphatase